MGTKVPSPVITDLYGENMQVTTLMATVWFLPFPSRGLPTLTFCYGKDLSQNFAAMTSITCDV